MILQTRLQVTTEMVGNGMISRMLQTPMWQHLIKKYLLRRTVITIAHSTDFRSSITTPTAMSWRNVVSTMSNAVHCKVGSLIILRISVSQSLSSLVQVSNISTTRKTVDVKNMMTVAKMWICGSTRKTTNAIASKEWNSTVWLKAALNSQLNSVRTEVNSSIQLIKCARSLRNVKKVRCPMIRTICVWSRFKKKNKKRARRMANSLTEACAKISSNVLKTILSSTRKLINATKSLRKRASTDSLCWC